MTYKVNIDDLVAWRKELKAARAHLRNIGVAESLSGYEPEQIGQTAMYNNLILPPELSEPLSKSIEQIDCLLARTRCFVDVSESGHHLE